MKKLSNLAWIDLEMTGLNPQTDVILEIASIVTDKDLNVLREGPSFVIKQPQNKLDEMSEIVREMHKKSGLLYEVEHSKINIEEAKKKTLEFFEDYCFPGVSPLCGNSIWQDRRFLRRYIPELDDFFNYRIIDVSSIKEVIRRWYAADSGIIYAKKETHRALSDIQESIGELSYYKQNFFKAS